MEIPSKVSVFNKTLELKGKVAQLVALDDRGFYELTMEVNQKVHTVLLPIAETVVIFNDPQPEIEVGVEIER